MHQKGRMMLANSRYKIEQETRHYALSMAVNFHVNTDCDCDEHTICETAERFVGYLLNGVLPEPSEPHQHAEGEEPPDLTPVAHGDHDAA